MSYHGRIGSLLSRTDSISPLSQNIPLCSDYLLNFFRNVASSNRRFECFVGNEGLKQVYQSFLFELSSLNEVFY